MFFQIYKTINAEKKGLRVALCLFDLAFIHQIKCFQWSWIFKKIFKALSIGPAGVSGPIGPDLVI